MEGEGIWSDPLPVEGSAWEGGLRWGDSHAAVGDSRSKQCVTNAGDTIEGDAWTFDDAEGAGCDDEVLGSWVGEMDEGDGEVAEERSEEWEGGMGLGMGMGFESTWSRGASAFPPGAASAEFEPAETAEPAGPASDSAASVAGIAARQSAGRTNSTAGGAFGSAAPPAGGGDAGGGACWSAEEVKRIMASLEQQSQRVLLAQQRKQSRERGQLEQDGVGRWMGMGNGDDVGGRDVVDELAKGHAEVARGEGVGGLGREDGGGTFFDEAKELERDLVARWGRDGDRGACDEGSEWTQEGVKGERRDEGQGGARDDGDSARGGGEEEGRTFFDEVAGLQEELKGMEGVQGLTGLQELQGVAVEEGFVSSALEGSEPGRATSAITCSTCSGSIDTTGITSNGSKSTRSGFSFEGACSFSTGSGARERPQPAHGESIHTSGLARARDHAQPPAVPPLAALPALCEAAPRGALECGMQEKSGGAVGPQGVEQGRVHRGKAQLGSRGGAKGRLRGRGFKRGFLLGGEDRTGKEKGSGVLGESVVEGAWKEKDGGRASPVSGGSPGSIDSNVGGGGAAGAAAGVDAPVASPSHAPQAAHATPAASPTDEAQAVFARVHPLCMAVVDARGDHQQLPHAIKRLEEAIGHRDVPVGGLQACLEFILFPLLLVLSPPTLASTPSSSKPPASAAAGEGWASSTENDHAAGITPPSAALASMSGIAQSEEARLLAVRCLSALLSHLPRCSPSSCCCAAATSGQSTSASSNSSSKSSGSGASSKCVAGVLQAQEAAPLLGHLLSNMLAAAEAEAWVGTRGSQVVRVEALRAVRLLVDGVSRGALHSTRLHACMVALRVAGLAHGSCLCYQLHQCQRLLSLPCSCAPLLPPSRTHTHLTSHPSLICCCTAPCPRPHPIPFDTAHASHSQAHTPAALAFFLPGILSGLSRAALAPFSPRSNEPLTRGAAADPSAVAEALLGLSQALVLVMGDAYDEDGHDEGKGEENEQGSERWETEEERALSMLQQMVGRMEGRKGEGRKGGEGEEDWLGEQGVGSEGELQGEKASGTAGTGEGAVILREVSVRRRCEEESNTPPTHAGTGVGRAGAGGAGKGGRGGDGRARGAGGGAGRGVMVLRVEMDEAWRRETGAKVLVLLHKVLPKMLHFPAPKVRCALVDMLGELLLRCPCSLSASRPLLLECVLLLASDHWPSVASSARRLLARAVITEHKPAPPSLPPVAAATGGAVPQKCIGTGCIEVANVALAEMVERHMASLATPAPPTSHFPPSSLPLHSPLLPSPTLSTVSPVASASHLQATTVSLRVLAAGVITAGRLPTAQHILDPAFSARLSTAISLHLPFAPGSPHTLESSPAPALALSPLLGSAVASGESPGVMPASPRVPSALRSAATGEESEEERWRRWLWVVLDQHDGQHNLNGSSDLRGATEPSVRVLQGALAVDATAPPLFWFCRFLRVLARLAAAADARDTADTGAGGVAGAPTTWQQPMGALPALFQPLLEGLREAVGRIGDERRRERRRARAKKKERVDVEGMGKGVEEGERGQAGRRQGKEEGGRRKVKGRRKDGKSDGEKQGAERREVEGRKEGEQDLLGQVSAVRAASSFLLALSEALAGISGGPWDPRRGGEGAEMGSGAVQVEERREEEEQRDQQLKAVAQRDDRWHVVIGPVVQSVLGELLNEDLWDLPVDVTQGGGRAVQSGGGGEWMGEEERRGMMRRLNENANLQAVSGEQRVKKGYWHGSGISLCTIFIFSYFPFALTFLFSPPPIRCSSYPSQQRSQLSANHTPQTPVPALVAANMDYAIATVCQGLSTLHCHPSAPRLLLAVMHLLPLVPPASATAAPAAPVLPAAPAVPGEYAGEAADSRLHQADASKRSGSSAVGSGGAAAAGSAVSVAATAASVLPSAFESMLPLIIHPSCAGRSRQLLVYPPCENGTALSFTAILVSLPHSAFPILPSPFCLPHSAFPILPSPFCLLLTAFAFPLLPSPFSLPLSQIRSVLASLQITARLQHAPHIVTLVQVLRVLMSACAIATSAKRADAEAAASAAIAVLRREERARRKQLRKLRRAKEGCGGEEGRSRLDARSGLDKPYPHVSRVSPESHAAGLAASPAGIEARLAPQGSSSSSSLCGGSGSSGVADSGSARDSKSPADSAAVRAFFTRRMQAAAAAVRGEGALSGTEAVEGKEEEGEMLGEGEREEEGNSSDEEWDNSGSDTESEGDDKEEAREEGNAAEQWSVRHVLSQLSDRTRVVAMHAQLAAACLEACGPLMASRDAELALLAADVAQTSVAAMSASDVAQRARANELEAVREVVRLRVKRAKTHLTALQDSGLGTGPAIGLESGLGGGLGSGLLDWLEDDVAGLQADLASLQDDVAAMHDTEDALKVADAVRDETNWLLPRVHMIWPHAVSGLTRSHPALIISSIHVITALSTTCDDAFMARKIREDSWPLMAALLLQGPPLPSYSSPSFSCSSPSTPFLASISSRRLTNPSPVDLTRLLTLRPVPDSGSVASPSLATEPATSNDSEGSGTEPTLTSRLQPMSRSDLLLTPTSSTQPQQHTQYPSPSFPHPPLPSSSHPLSHASIMAPSPSPTLSQTTSASTSTRNAATSACSGVAPSARERVQMAVLMWIAEVAQSDRSREGGGVALRSVACDVIVVLMAVLAERRSGGEELIHAFRDGGNSSSSDLKPSMVKRAAEAAVSLGRAHKENVTTFLSHVIQSIASTSPPQLSAAAQRSDIVVVDGGNSTDGISQNELVKVAEASLRGTESSSAAAMAVPLVRTTSADSPLRAPASLIPDADCLDVPTVLVVLPDGSVRLYDTRRLTVCDVLCDYPSHALSCTTTGPVLQQQRVLNLNATYYLRRVSPPAAAAAAEALSASVVSVQNPDLQCAPFSAAHSPHDTGGCPKEALDSSFDAPGEETKMARSASARNLEQNRAQWEHVAERRTSSWDAADPEPRRHDVSDGIIRGNRINPILAELETLEDDGEVPPTPSTESGKSSSPTASARRTLMGKLVRFKLPIGRRSSSYDQASPVGFRTENTRVSPRTPRSPCPVIPKSPRFKPSGTAAANTSVQFELSDTDIACHGSWGDNLPKASGYSRGGEWVDVSCDVFTSDTRIVRRAVMLVKPAGTMSGGARNAQPLIQRNSSDPALAAGSRAVTPVWLKNGNYTQQFPLPVVVPRQSRHSADFISSTERCFTSPLLHRMLET
ncbi:unnamed protein product [Closterium sp. NIES-65]|nr:unnamed protein product [Closterium sp. NIES-65]